LGFTLLELIVTVTAAAVFGVVLFGFLNPLSRVAEPLQSTDNLLSVNQVMARIVADYEAQGISAAWDANALGGFVDALGDEGEKLTNKYGTYTVLKNRFWENPSAAAANNPYLLTIEVEGRRATHLLTMRAPPP
jgi:type II secretory pathway pseudopilin PulG